MRRRIPAAIILLLLSTSLYAQTERIKLDGMHMAGTITRDDRGIAHVYALNEHDVLFLQGYVHAQDRFFQMDFNRRIASGTLAELVGMPAIGSDVQLRTLGLRRAAQFSWGVTPPEVQAVLGGYAKGVNAWLAKNSLPMEYGALEITQVPPWTPVDSILIAKLIAFSLAFSLDTDNTIALLTWQGVGQAAGFNGAALFFEDLFRTQPFGSAATVPDASGIPADLKQTSVAAEMLAQYAEAARSLHPSVLDLAREVSENFGSNEWLEAAFDRDFFYGSNEWAISGDHTTTGRPMIANDPHLALTTPSTFYPMALQGGGINAIGIGFPGAPYIIQGHTPHVAWGSTNNPMDVTDVFLEEVVIVPQAWAGLATKHGDSVEWLFPILQQWRVNVIGDGALNNLQVVPPGGPIPIATLIVPRRNAPIVALDPAAGTALSVQHTGFGPTREIEAFRAFNRARNIEDFRTGLQWFDFGSQNWVVTDTGGDIAYFTSGEMPLREDLQAGTVDGLPPWFIRKGSGGNDWIRNLNPPANQATLAEILPFNEMPQITNPPRGFFVNANNDPAGHTLDNNPLNQLRPGGGIFYLAPGYDGFRATRITQMIEEKLDRGEKISFRDMQAMQADTVMIDAQFFVPWIVQALDNAMSSSAHPALAQFAASPAIQGAVQRLGNWDFSTPTGIIEGFDSTDVNGQRLQPTEAQIASSVAATIYSLWRGQFIGNTVDAFVGGVEQLAGMPLPRPGSLQVMNSLRHFFDTWEERRGFGASGLTFFNVPGLSGTDAATRNTVRDILILKSIADAAGLAVSEEFAPAFQQSLNMNDWRWGKLHRVVFAHNLGGPLSIPPAGGAFPPPLPGLPGIPTDGGFGTVDASAHNVRAAGVNSFMFGSGPVRRTVAEARADGIYEETSLPGGTSGFVGSPFYMNLLPMWLTNDAFPLVLRDLPRIPWVR
jgi:penicillin G amidase